MPSVVPLPVSLGTVARQGKALTGLGAFTVPCLATVLAALLLADAPATRAADAAAIRVLPPAVTLRGPESSAQVLVWENRTDGRPAADLTEEASYRVANPSIVSVDARGRLTPLAEGDTELVIQAGGDVLIVPVGVAGIAAPEPISFRTEILPILTKAGCNSGGCHGKAEGQHGFQLSIFGFDPLADHQALTQQTRGRRIMPTLPERSLLLQKATAAIPHGGGGPLDRGSPGYRRLLRWIAEGAALDAGEAAVVKGIRVEPNERLLALGGRQQLRVTAVDSAGRSRDVTAEAQYDSNAPAVAAVDEQGLVQGGVHPGEAAILVRHLDHVAVCRIRMPRPDATVARPPENNFIDRLAWDKLEQMGIQPSPPCDDATFLRRVYLDTIGTLPTAAQARQFLDSSEADKRAALINQLLDRPEYATYWSLRWSDLLRVDAETLDAESAVAMTRWLRRQFQSNRSYDQMVYDILTARGSTRSESPAGLYVALDDPKELGSAMSQLFLGVRIDCAECHHHPFERWSQRDFYAFAGFFTGIKRKTLSDGASSVMVQPGTDLQHPRTAAHVPAAGLAAAPAEWEANEQGDRRRALADWMTDPGNPWFARALANRLWAHYFGRGLVEPVDDLRATNPATNEPLLDALARHLQEVDYDVKAFTRTLLRSRVYQLSTQTNATNAHDDQHFSRAAYRSLPAEVLLDAISQVSGVPEKFNGWPQGARAIEVWDNRMPSYFFRIFGRPARTTVCQCERGDAPTISQALHLMNSPEIAGKIQHRRGRARRLADSDRTPRQIVEQLYLSALSRQPSPEEETLALQIFHQDEVDRRAATEDVLWAIINTKEFLFNH